MWIERKIQKSLMQMSSVFPITHLTGIRKTGKTALIQNNFPSAPYYDLQSRAVQKDFLNFPEKYLSDHETTIIFDNCHLIKNFPQIVKKYLNQPVKPNSYIFISSKNQKFIDTINLNLLGQCCTLELSPLSFQEVNTHFPQFTVDDYIYKGGFPENYVKEISDQELEKWYETYILDVIQNEIKNARSIHQQHDFFDFFDELSSQIGDVISYSELSRKLQLAPNTVKSWIKLLNQLGYIHLLKAYTKTPKKKLAKFPKLYFVDSGLSCFFYRINTLEKLKESQYNEIIWKNVIHNEIIAKFHNQVKIPRFWHWRTAYGEEVDFLFENEGKLKAWMGSYKNNPISNFTRGFQALEKYYGKDNILTKSLVQTHKDHAPLTSNNQNLKIAELLEILPDAPH